jgi:hypothetical protein
MQQLEFRVELSGLQICCDTGVGYLDNLLIKFADPSYSSRLTNKCSAEYPWALVFSRARSALSNNRRSPIFGSTPYKVTLGLKENSPFFP